MSGLGMIGRALAAGLSGAGEGMAQGVTEEMKEDARLKEIQATNDAQLAKEKAIAKYTSELADQKRAAMSARIESFRPGAAKDQADKNFATSDAAVADADAGRTDAPLSGDQRKVISEARAAELTKLASDPHTYIAAAIKSGDIDPQAVAHIVMQEDSYKRQEASQAAQFAHSDKSQKEQFAHMDASQRQQFAHADALQRQAQAFSSDEKQKNRDAAMARNMPPADITQDEKNNWISTYVRNGGSVPRSAPNFVRNSIGTWAAQAGITPNDIAKGTAQAKFDQSAAVTSGHRSGSMAGVEAAIPALVENAVSASSKINKGDFVPLNKLMMMGEDSISDPNLAAFRVAHQALASEYQQVIGRGGANVFALKEAMHVLEGAKSQEAYIAAANQVQKEVNINVAAMNKVRSNAGGSHAAETVPNPVAAPAAGGILTYDPRTGTFH